MNRRKPQNRIKPPPPKAAARVAKPSRLGLRAWREQHLYSFFSSLGRIAARPWTTLLTLLVLSLALTLPLLLFLLLDNARQLHGNVQDASAISVFLKPNVDSTVAQALAQRLRAREDVAAVLVKTPAQGLEEFRSQSGFAEALNVLHDNPLPAVLIVTPKLDAEDAGPLLTAELGHEPEVDLVQYDAAWRQRLDAILGVATRAAAALAGLLALAALLIVGNTVRLDIDGRADEIAVMQLLGAGNGFVRRPFLYTGLWYGAFSGILALILILAIEIILFGPLTRLVASYAQRFTVHGLSWWLACAALGASMLLGWLGAWLATARHLALGRSASR